jgi:ribosomal protein S18 acetylase RimI-like enzyme
VQDRVERGAVGAYPGLDGNVPPTLGAVARLMAAGRVDVHAADDVPGAGAEHGIGEPAALGEVLCVPFQVAEIVVQGHLARPAAIREPRRRPDVVNAGRPGGVIGLVVLRPERSQPEFPRSEPVGYREVFWNEQLITHPAIVTRHVAAGAKDTFTRSVEINAALGGAIFRRVEVRSLGYRTDLAILALEGSQITDRGDYLVIRTPGNPDYWWGNFLLLRDLRPGSGAAWLARFAAEFPGVLHIALGLDETGAGTVDRGELPGMTMEQHAVMTATSVHAPPHPNTEAVFRALEGDADWQESLDLAAAVHKGEPGGDAGFLAARLAAKRALTESGHGAWYGAFLDGSLVSQLGLIANKSGLARYQDVETHPACRRRGLAGTLVWHAGATGLTGDTSKLVMVADPADVAIRVYRSVGFTVTEDQLGFIRRPAG